MKCVVLAILCIVMLAFLPVKAQMSLQAPTLDTLVCLADSSQCGQPTEALQLQQELGNVMDHSQILLAAFSEGVADMSDQITNRIVSLTNRLDALQQAMRKSPLTHLSLS